MQSWNKRIRPSENWPLFKRSARELLLVNFMQTKVWTPLNGNRRLFFYFTLKLLIFSTRPTIFIILASSHSYSKVKWTIRHLKDDVVIFTPLMINSSAGESRCRSRPSGGINTWSLIRFCSDPTGRELRDYFITSGINRVIYHFWVFLFCKVDCWLELEVKWTLLHECSVTERDRKPEPEPESLLSKYSNTC